MSTGMLKVGYNELLEILSMVRNSTDSKTPILLNELTELSKQARFQPWADFKYDVVNTINKLYPNYVSNCKEDSLPYVLHFMLHGKSVKSDFTEEEFCTYFEYIVKHGTCVCTPFGMRPEVYAISYDNGVNVRATSCAEGYIKYIQYFVNDVLYLDIVRDYHTGISIKRCTGEFTLEVFKALMNSLISK